MSHFKNTCRPRHSRRRARRGVAAAEFAVCLPVIVLLVLAAIEACSMVFLKQSLTISAYEGARTALVDGATAGDVQAIANQILVDRRIQGGSISINPGNIQALEAGDFIDVTVTAPCDANTLLPNLFYRGRTLSSNASMMIEF